MIWFCWVGCSSDVELVVPSAEIFIEESEAEGVLQIAAYKGSVDEESICTTLYSLDGELEDCDECSWEADFALSLLSENCVFSDLVRLRFQANENRWMVLEQTGWEHWGEAIQTDDGVWRLKAIYALLP